MFHSAKNAAGACLVALSLVVGLVMASSVVLAQALPESKAESWGLQNEKSTVVSGKVVDILCELAGDCPDKCGAGSRQLGILQKTGALLIVAKNGQPLFNGAVDDLLPFCRLDVHADGLMAGDDKNQLFQIQRIQTIGTNAWVDADRWTKVWSERNPTLAKDTEEWFYHDPRIQKQVDANGYFGLGAATDVEFIKKQ